MPWDATRLVVAATALARSWPVAPDGSRSASRRGLPDGSLWFFGDRTGFWTLHRWTADGGVEPMVDLGKDIGFPQLGLRAAVLRLPRRRPARLPATATAASTGWPYASPTSGA